MKNNVFRKMSTCPVRTSAASLPKAVTTILLVFAGVALFGVDRAGGAKAEAGETSNDSAVLFNGKDLSGWSGDERFWSVEDGAITGRTTAETPAPHNTFLIYKGGAEGQASPVLRDFELRLKFKISNHNSGVQYRSKDLGNHVVAGYQADIVADAEDRYTGILYEEKGRGILAERGQKVSIDAAGKKTVEPLGDAKELGKAIRKGDWNEYVITARGNHLTETINGTTTVDVTDAQEGKAAREGILALQIHTGPPMVVQFKDIRLKTLP
jgi:hypothetical protein